jgi:hypothetical protein
MSDKTKAISAILVPLKTDVSGFSKGLKEASKAGEKFHKDTTKGFESIARSSIEAVKSFGLFSLGMNALGKVAGKTFDVLTSGFDRIKSLGNDALSIGTTSEELSRLRNVARGTGTDIKDLSDFVSSLTDKINDSIGHVELQKESFAKLGTSAEKLSKMTVGEQLKELNKGFNALPNDIEKSRVAMALAGEVGLKNYRLLTMSVEEFDKAYKDGLITTDDDVSEARKLQIAIDKIVDALEKLGNMFTSVVLPKLNQFFDIAIAFGEKFASILGVTIPKSSAKMADALGLGGKKADAKPVQDQKATNQAKEQTDLAERKAKYLEAQAKANKLQVQYDKQGQKIAAMKDRYVPTTNGMGYRNKKQVSIDQHNKNAQDLGEAKRDAEKRRQESLSPSEAVAEAKRMKQTSKELATLLDEYSETINNSGQDDVHRRVNAIKGLNSDQKKKALAQGYQAREAEKTTSLRDELQESTKLPQQKLAEDYNRINRMVGIEGGLTREQAIRAAAQKTQESGLGGPPKLSGALDANSIEGRSYLLEQMNRIDTDPVAIAKQGLALTGQTNNTLGKILTALTGQSQDVVYGY